jgi:hypothetical protein
LGKLEELGGGGGEGGKKPPSFPSGGFGFIPEYALIQTGKVVSLTLRASIPDKLPEGCNVSIVSSSPEVHVIKPQVQIKAREDYTGLGEVKVELEGRQVGAIAVITATASGFTAEASVQVISKKEPPGIPREKKENGGLFRDVKFDPAMEPRQRVRFDRSNANIVIATNAPSVAAYLDENGVGSEEPQGQVLLAELITEAVCFEIARRGVESGVFLAPEGGVADAIRREHINLQNKYAHLIHACFVDPTHRRNGWGSPTNKKRPSREQLATDAVIPLG